MELDEFSSQLFLLKPSYVKTQYKPQINTIVHFISKAQLVSYSVLNYCIFYLKPRTKYSRDMTCSCPPPPQVPQVINARRVTLTQPLPLSIYTMDYVVLYLYLPTSTSLPTSPLRALSNLASSHPLQISLYYSYTLEWI